MTIRKLMMFSFFLVLMPLMIVFTVESIFDANANANNRGYIPKTVATESNSEEKEVEKTETDAGDKSEVQVEPRVDPKVEQKSEPKKRNKLDSEHPLKYFSQQETDASVIVASEKSSNEQASDKQETDESEAFTAEGQDYSQKELDLLAKFIHAEATDESHEGKVAVGAVVMNRVNSHSYFGNTIEEVIFKNNQFSSVVNGAFDKAVPTDADYKAAKEVLEGANSEVGSLFYYNPKIVKSDWHETLNYTETVGNNKFFSEHTANKTNKTNKPAVITKIEKPKADKPKVEKPKDERKVEPKEEKSKVEPKEAAREDKEVKSEKTKSNNSSNTKSEESKKVISQTENTGKGYNYTSDELEMMAKIIHAEARGESYQGKLAVGAVIMNRLKSSSFPNTLKGVIFAKNQFSPVSDGSYQRAKPTQDDYKSAKEAFAGKDPTNGALYFYNPSIATNSWHETLNHTKTIGSHKFFK